MKPDEKAIKFCQNKVKKLGKHLKIKVDENKVEKKKALKIKVKKDNPESLERRRTIENLKRQKTKDVIKKKK